MQIEPAPEWLPVATVSTGPMAGEVTLVLLALGIPSRTLSEPAGRHVVWVEPQYRDAAQAALGDYVLENRPPPPAALPRPLAVGSIKAPLLYVLCEFGVAVAASRSAFGLSWVDRGVLEGPAFRSGQWWRPITALTLHADFAHLLANLGFGAVFLGLAARVYGWGVALLLTLFAAGCAGLLEASGLPGGTSSLGASTAVFAALGLLAPVRWPARGRLAPWMARAATFGGAIALLGLLGAGDVHVDVTAHALGFLAGVSAGWLLRGASIAGPALQRLCALLAGLLLLVAWSAALIS